jgi:hypothetical protein
LASGTRPRNIDLTGDRPNHSWLFYFSLTPNLARRILFVLRSERKSSGESLVDYYIRTYSHLIPEGLEIWEYSNENQSYHIHRP